MWNYILPLLTALFGLMQLLKDWTGHQTTLRRATVFALVIGLGLVSTLGIHNSRARERQQASKIGELTTAVETANKAQAANTKIFTDALAGFSAKLANLQTEIKTDDLRREADSLRTQLRKTQKALEPEQAVLAAGIDNPSERDRPLHETNASVRWGEPVAVDLAVSNTSNAAAHGLFFGVRICEVCKWHSEPEGATHPKGQIEAERTWVFPSLPTALTSQALPVSFDLPSTAPAYVDVVISVRWTCDNCKPTNWQNLTVHVTRN